MFYVFLKQIPGLAGGRVRGSNDPPLPPVRGERGVVGRFFDVNLASKAIETAKLALRGFTAGTPIVRWGPAGEVHVDVPVMYMGFAVDRVHYDPVSKTPSPKGRPARSWGVSVDESEARRVIEEALRNAWVVEAAEFREPENAWAVPIAWRNIVIMHVKVSYDGSEIVPDYGLTGEVRRHAL